MLEKHLKTFLLAVYWYIL